MERLKTRSFASRTSGIVSALVLAGVVTGVDLTDRFLDRSDFKPGQPSAVSVRLPMTGYMRLSFAVPVKVEYELDPFVIRAGEPVPDRAAEQYKLLTSTLERRADLLVYRAVGLFLVVFLMGFLLSEALRRSWPGNRRYLRTEITVYVLLGVLVLAAKPVFVFTAWPVFIFPAAALPIVVSYFRGRRLGVYVTMAVAFVLSAMLEFDAVVFIVFLVQGLSVIPFLKPSRKFRPLALAAVVTTVTGLVTLFGLSLALSGSREIVGIADWRNSQLLAVMAGGLLSGLVGWVLALAIRPVLGIVSQSRLNDLQELQQPLLKRLQQQAPGTWEHSRAIANLAEEAASKIDADALLVRVGSYFHDLGKAVNPNLFVENQEAGDDGRPINPHDEMAPDRSASLIIDHVLQGVQILRNNGIPEAVVEFSYMHHGSSLIEYFWNKYLEQARKEGVEKPELTLGDFRYPGIPPQSPETAIMMLADSVEATSRTVTEPTVERFQRMVNRIIFTKLNEGQLDDCGLRVEDLKIVGQSFVESLYFSRHKRVRYQWQEREDADDKADRESGEPEREPGADEGEYSVDVSVEATEDSGPPAGDEREEPAAAPTPVSGGGGEPEQEPPPERVSHPAEPAADEPRVVLDPANAEHPRRRPAVEEEPRREGSVSSRTLPGVGPAPDKE
jgi:hypothetical protein